MEAKDKIIRIIEHIRPYMLADGGDIEFVSFEDGIVTVRFGGACANCGLVTMDLNVGVKNWLISEVPEVKDVIIEEAGILDFGFDGTNYDY